MGPCTPGDNPALPCSNNDLSNIVLCPLQTPGLGFSGASKMSSPTVQGILSDDARFYDLAAMLPKLAEALPGGDETLIRISDARRLRYLDHTSQRQRKESTMDVLIEQTSTPAMFCYQPLEGELAFRLLVLHPGEFLDPLSGTLEHDVVRKKSNASSFYPRDVKYDAISYAWNSNVKSSSILLDGQKAMITESLFNALVRFRRSDRDRRVWADALCINQEDSKERAAQVTLMPEIYTYAAKTLVYLGEHTDHSELVPKFVDSVIKLDIGRIRQTQPNPNTTHASALNLPAKDDPAWEAIVRFFCRPWFSRVWVVQEVILARDARFYCGDWELSWWQMAEMGSRFDECRRSSSADFRDADLLQAQQGAVSIALMHGFQHTRSVVAERLADLEAAISSPLPPPKPRFDLEPQVLARRNSVIGSFKKYPKLFPEFKTMALGSDSIKAPTTPILKLLGVFSSHDASVPRDKLFALVGLAGDVTLNVFPPNYEESERETNARFSRVLIQKGQGMDVLYHATKSAIEPDMGFYPSWSPYWTVPQSMQLRHWLSLGWAYLSHPGGFGAPTAPVDAVMLDEYSPDLLRVRSFRLDNLQGSNCIARVDLTDFKMEAFAERCHKYFEDIEQVLNGKSYFTGESWEEVQCRTLVADRGFERGSRISENLADYIKVKQELPNFTTPGARPSLNGSGWLGSWLKLAPQYAVCRTSKGYAGLVPYVTSEGDEIVMLEGSDLPFVLRPTPFPGYFHFIGGCYIHGLMKGEAWKHVAERKNILLI